MKVLITGGAGFIGSLIAQRCHDRGDEILIIDNFISQVHGDDETIQAKIEKLTEIARVENFSICDSERLSSTVIEFNPELAFHMAAETGTGQSKDEWKRYIDTNINGTVHLLTALNNCKDFRKLILPSSRSVYGEGVYSDGHEAIFATERKTTDMKNGLFGIYNEAGSELTPLKTKETFPPNTSSLYASTKLMQEYIVKQSAKNEWAYCILRFQNVYGAGQSLNNPYTGVLSIFCKQIISGLTLNIYEDGNIYRDFVYVDDIVNACMLSSSVEESDGETYNVGSGLAVKITDIAEILLESLNRPKDAYEITGYFRDGDIRYACADITKIGKQLGWEPRIDIKTGLKKLVEWVRKEI